MDLLGDELDAIAEACDIDMGEFGFDLDSEEETEVVEDEVPEEVEPVCKKGEIWQLGEHRLMCGDSTSAEDVSRLMDGSKANLLFTDPPYGVSYEKKTKEVLKSKNYTKIQNDDLKLDQFKDFLFDVFTNARASLLDSASYYVFSCQGGDQEMMMMMMRECGIPCRHQIIWVKDAPVFSMGRLDYDYKHEPILYGWVKKHDFQRKGEQDKSVWEFKRTENKLHPTMKPVPLIANALLNSTKGEDVVLDLFGGSGSTLIACEQLNRKCRMMELDPHYCDVIIARWEKLTGQKAEKLGGADGEGG
jgi:site-specific DNA-methyltransferase (adenine-specific)